MDELLQRTIVLVSVILGISIMVASYIANYGSLEAQKEIIKKCNEHITQANEKLIQSGNPYFVISDFEAEIGEIKNKT